MARTKPTDEQWAAARLVWETDPLKSHGDVGKILAISKQAVQRKANADGWQKRLTNDEAAERAYQVADNINVTTHADAPSKSAGHVVAAPGQNAPHVVDAAVDDVVGKRAAVLDRHRTEVMGVRRLVYDGMKGAGDAEKAKIAKASAESLRLVQEMERKAWGFDRDDNKQPLVSVHIERARRPRHDD